MIAQSRLSPVPESPVCSVQASPRPRCSLWCASVRKLVLSLGRSTKVHGIEAQAPWQVQVDTIMIETLQAARMFFDGAWTMFKCNASGSMRNMVGVRGIAKYQLCSFRMRVLQRGVVVTVVHQNLGGEFLVVRCHGIGPDTVNRRTKVASFPMHDAAWLSSRMRDLVLACA